MQRSSGILLAATELASTTRVNLDLRDVADFTLHLELRDVAPAAKTFVDANVNVSANTITKTGHGYVTGTKVAATTTGVLPGGLSATNYYVIKVDADTLKLASSLANAEAGTAVDITSAAGGGTHTLTPATSSNNQVLLQVRNSEDAAWVTWGGTLANIDDSYSTVTTSFFDSREEAFGAYRFVSVLYSPNAGQSSVAIYAGYIRK